jgi:soluble lytic murein transglycosylase-like protein
MSKQRSISLLAIVIALAAPIVAHADDTSTYTVRRGDGFYRIARITGVSLDAILAANGLTIKSVIHPGQVLTIPRPSLPNEVAAHGDLVPAFRAAAQEAGVPADLLMAIAYHESRWRADAVSSTGALGIGQLMPKTAAWVARDLIGEPNLDPRKPADNIRISARLFRWLFDRAGGDVDQALAMYAQGVEGVRRDGVRPSSVKFAAQIAALRLEFT